MINQGWINANLRNEKLFIYLYSIAFISCIVRATGNVKNVQWPLQCLKALKKWPDSMFKRTYKKRNDNNNNNNKEM